MSAFSSQPRILVSGGGVIGLSCALELAQAGAQVTLIDAAQFGGMASTAAAGMLAPGAEAIQDSADADYVALCLRSLSLWPEFAARVEAHSGQALSVNRTGSLILAQSSEEAETWADVTLVRDLGPQPLSGFTYDPRASPERHCYDRSGFKPDNTLSDLSPSRTARQRWFPRRTA